MKKTRVFFTVKCWRCDKVTRTSRANGLPKGWAVKTIFLGGIMPAAVKVCRKCKWSYQ